MKIDIVGNMCTWTKENSTSFILNNELLFDVPEGSFKTILNDYGLEKVKYIILSHFHSDHYIDVHIVLDYIFNNYPDRKLTVIAPKGCYERLTTLFSLVEITHLQKHLDSRVSFIDLEDGKEIKLGQYKIKAYRVNHADVEAYGFIIKHGKTKVGFSGDTAMCDNLKKILKAVPNCFVDTAGVQITNKHLSVQEVVELQKEYTKCKLHMIHLSYHSKKLIDELSLEYPQQGDVIDC